MTDQLEQTSQATAPASSPPSEPAFVVPDAYKGKGWVEKVKSPDDLWKTLDNAQSLLGKRPAGIPANDAPDAEWQAFYKAARPESADKYTLSDIDGIDATEIAAVKKNAQAMMYEAGLTPKQADALWKQYLSDKIKDAEAKEAELDKRFDEIAAKVLGDKLTAAQPVAQEAIKTYVSEELRTSFVQNPEGMVAMIQLSNGYEGKLAEKNAEIDKIKAEYGVEGKLPSGEATLATNINDTVTKLAQLRLSPEARDFTKPGHAKVMAEITELQGIVARHYNKG